MAERKKSFDHQVFGHTVRVCRAKAGLSQEELGFRSGLHRNYVGAIERGEINPTFRVLLKLQRGFELPLSDIIGDYERERVVWIRSGRGRADDVRPRVDRPAVSAADDL